MIGRRQIHVVSFVDIKELLALGESFAGVTGAVTELPDLEGKILVQTGWRDSWTCFHLEVGS